MRFANLNVFFSQRKQKYKSYSRFQGLSTSEKINTKSDKADVYKLNEWNAVKMQFDYNLL